MKDKGNVLSRPLGIVGRVLAVVALCGGFLFASPAMAQGTLDSSFPALADYVGNIATALALVITAVLGVTFALLVVRGGIRWVRGFATR